MAASSRSEISVPTATLCSAEPISTAVKLVSGAASASVHISR